MSTYADFFRQHPRTLSKPPSRRTNHRRPLPSLHLSAAGRSSRLRAERNASLGPSPASNTCATAEQSRKEWPVWPTRLKPFQRQSTSLLWSRYRVRSNACSVCAPTNRPSYVGRCSTQEPEENSVARRGTTSWRSSALQRGRRRRAVRRQRCPYGNTEVLHLLYWRCQTVDELLPPKTR